MANTIIDRWRASDQRFQDLKNEVISRRIETYVNKKACIYVTGSYARGEASSHSDVDLFIVGLVDKNIEKDDNGYTRLIENRKLSRLDEICVKAVLIQAIEKLGISKFSGDGRYLTHYTTSELLKTLGHPTDDSTNTFTARLLLLLESKPLYDGDQVYKTAIDEVIAEYWKDYADHSSSFIPAFLANDILRLWRTFCVNYEARTKKEPDDLKAERKLVNYKLKHSRLLTCFSSLIYMLVLYQENGTVSIDDAKNLSNFTPTERLERVYGIATYSRTRPVIEQLFKLYEKFLRETDNKKDVLIENFKNKEKADELMQDAYTFGDKIYELLELVKPVIAEMDRKRFYRILTV